MILSDYGKGTLPAPTIAALIAVAQEAGRPVVPVVVDPKGRDFSVYRGAHVIKPNRRELHQATGLPTDDDDQMVAACRALMDQAGIANVLATRSERGMTLLQSETPAQHFPAAAHEVFDVSGAGDTVVAVLAAALAAGCDLGRGARLANIAAGVVVAKLGTAVAYPEDILRAHTTADLLSAEAKVVEEPAMLEHAARWRRRGLTLGFTNGCFDLLHPGHVSLLRQARAACDRLVVGLNSDTSVGRLKGAGRPVQAEAARAAVLASLADVDLVVVFGEDTPLKLIETLGPDVLVKGADYTADQIAGADVVRRNGGRVVLAELLPGYTTTGTIAKLKT